MPQKKPNRSKIIAVDIGGTKIMTALFSSSLHLLAKETRPTRAKEGVQPVIERLTEFIETILKNNDTKSHQISCIAIACAGGIDTGRGLVVTPSPNMPGWSNVPLAEIIGSRFNCQTYLLNDASAAALGEHCFGIGRNVDNIVLFTLGTGIGGGIIANGSLYLGADGAAGELGHMTIMDDGPPCRCGNKGCLEMFCSGTAVAQEAIRRLRQNEKSLLSELAKGKIENITAKMVETAARRGDTLARETIAGMAYYLGVGAVNIVNIFNPALIILGGGMAALGDLLLEPLHKIVHERSFSISAHSLRIVTAKLGNEAGIYGAAAFAGTQIKKEIREEQAQPSAYKTAKEFIK